MRLAFRLLAYATLLLVLLMAGFIGDLVLNKRRFFYAMLGRDELVAACRPPLVEKLRSLGFEPADIELGGTPDITISTATGKTIRDTLTFTDGASQARVDGVVTCSRKAETVTVDVQTATTPTRAS